MDIRSLLDKMSTAEESFLNTEFLAPVLAHGRVQMRIAGLVCTLRVLGRPRPGWAILKPSALDAARVVARPALQQIRAYLALFPAVRLLLLSRAGPDWLAWPAQRGDRRLELRGPVRVHLAEGVEPLQQILARFDGGHFWFQEVDRRRNPAIAAYLRAGLEAEMPAAELHKPTLTAEEREAYQVLADAMAAARRDRVEVRLTDALAHAGARFASYIEREDAYTVSYTIDGRLCRSTVRKDDLSVLVAGICLRGHDRRFDLQSLVGVIRQGAQERRIVQVGDLGLAEDDYWDIHPPLAEP